VKEQKCSLTKNVVLKRGKKQKRLTLTESLSEEVKDKRRKNMKNTQNRNINVLRKRQFMKDMHTESNTT